MPLIYAFVAQGTTVLAEYTPFHGNFSAVALECLQHLQTGNTGCVKHVLSGRSQSMLDHASQLLGAVDGRLLFC
jgi:hypothetical protein